jgi:hypothetical protein
MFLVLSICLLAVLTTFLCSGAASKFGELSLALRREPSGLDLRCANDNQSPLKLPIPHKFPHLVAKGCPEAVDLKSLEFRNDVVVPKQVVCIRRRLVNAHQLGDQSPPTLVTKESMIDWSGSLGFMRNVISLTAAGGPLKPDSGLSGAMELPDKVFRLPVPA